LELYSFAPQNKKYETPESIFEAYYPLRLQLYHKRKRMLEKESEYLSVALTNKARFIQMVINGTISLTSGKTSKAETVNSLSIHGFPTKSDLEKIRLIDNTNFRDTDAPLILSDDTTMDEDEGLKDFDYLLSLPLASLTSDRIDSLLLEASKAKDAWSNISNLTAEDLWRQDLDRLLPNL
jgi:DNA topoisomerase-2